MSGKVYEHRTAYRHENGEVEGFIGSGTTKKSAVADAHYQIQKKIDILCVYEGESGLYDKNRIVGVLSSLTPAEIDTVQKDWRSGVRY